MVLYVRQRPHHGADGRGELVGHPAEDPGRPGHGLVLAHLREEQGCGQCADVVAVVIGHGSVWVVLQGIHEEPEVYACIAREPDERGVFEIRVLKGALPRIAAQGGGRPRGAGPDLANHAVDASVSHHAPVGRDDGP